MIRAFLGIPLPPLAPLAHLARELGAFDDALKVVDPDRFHLTLHFFGDIPRPEAEAFVDGLRTRPLPKAFDIHVRGVGAFPKWTRPNVLWAGIDDRADGLARLADAARATAQALGHATDDRPFRAHLTLARRRGRRGLDAAMDTFGAYRDHDFGSARIDRINLYQSTLGPQGPRYDVLREVVL